MLTWYDGLLKTRVKNKVMPVQASRGSEGSRRFRLPDFKTNRPMKVVRLSAVRTGLLYPPKYYWYSFLLEAESKPGP